MLILNLSLGSELVPNHLTIIPFDHVTLKLKKTKYFTFAADYMLGVYPHNYRNAISKLTRILISKNQYNSQFFTNDIKKICKKLGKE